MYPYVYIYIYMCVCVCVLCHDVVLLLPVLFVDYLFICICCVVFFVLGCLFILVVARAERYSELAYYAGFCWRPSVVFHVLL